LGEKRGVHPEKYRKQLGVSGGAKEDKENHLERRDHKNIIGKKVSEVLGDKTKASLL